MKVVGVVGSPRRDGNTSRLVAQVLKGASEKGAETKLFQLGEMTVAGCVACYYCKSHETCAIKDDMQTLYQEIQSADALVVGSPVYMGQMTGQTKVFMDRLFAFINEDFSNRLIGKKKLLLVFTQGIEDTSTYSLYLEQTKQVFGFLGFVTEDVIVAGKTLGKTDVESQTALMQEAKQKGSNLTVTEKV